MADPAKYPHPWRMERNGFGSWAVLDVNDQWLFSIEALSDFDAEEGADVFSHEIGENDIFDEGTPRSIAPENVPLIRQLERLFYQGPA